MGHGLQTQMEFTSIGVAGELIRKIELSDPFELGSSFLKRLADILRSDIWDGTRALIFAASNPEALLADVAETAKFDLGEALQFSALGQQVCAAMEALPFPVIAQVQGAALGGGCELTLACDFVFAGAQARFGQIEVLGGVVPGFGGTWRLPRRVGDLKARELLLTGVILAADEAFEAGLVNEVVPPSALSNRVVEWANLLAKKPALALASAKRLLLANRSLSLEQSNLEEGKAFGSLFGTHDQREGMEAFVQKREPRFTGH